MGGAPGHTRNTAYLGSVEAFWGLGMNLLSMGTVLPVFLQERGASNALIAFLPAMSALGAGLAQAFSGFIGGDRPRLKPMVMWLHVTASAPLLLAGCFLLWGRLPAVPVVLLFWALFYAFIGLLFPIGMAYMARILDPARRGRALGIVFLTQTLAGVLGVTLAAALLKGGTSDLRYAVLFFAGGAAIAGGSFFFLGTREEVQGDPAERPTVRGHLRDLVGFLLTPASVLAPLAGGWLMDRVGFRPVVAGVAVLVAAAMALAAFSLPAGRAGSEE